MKASELRIGNLIEFDGEVIKTSIIDLTNLSNPNLQKTNELYKQISQTEEWLLKFGAVLQQDKVYHCLRLQGNEECEFNNAVSYELDDYRIFVKGGRFFFIIDENEDDVSDNYTSVEVDTVHLLQNVFYFNKLTGEELTIND